MVRDGDAGSDYDCDCQCVEGTPFFGISILAKPQTIPDDYYEAAKIDGAGVFQRFST